MGSVFKRAAWAAALAAGMVAAPVQAAITLVPSTSSVRVGDTIVFTIGAAAADEVFTLDAAGGFDPALFTFLGFDSDIAAGDVLFVDETGSAAGDISLAYVGLGGSTTLGSLSFRARAVGTGALDLLGSYRDPALVETPFRAQSPAVTIAAAVGTVPEPAAWGMLILGCGVMGAQLRRRRVPARLAA